MIKQSQEREEIIVEERGGSLKSWCQLHTHTHTHKCIESAS